MPTLWVDLQMVTSLLCSIYVCCNQLTISKATLSWMENNSFQRFCFRLGSVYRFQYAVELCVDYTWDQHKISVRLIKYTIYSANLVKIEDFLPKGDFPKFDHDPEMGSSLFLIITTWGFRMKSNQLYINVRTKLQYFQLLENFKCTLLRR